VYVFTDPNCPYCNKFWADAQAWVDSGKVQLRHIMVGILTPTSADKAAALLGDKNPAAALNAYEQSHASTNAKVLASGHPELLDDTGLKPVTNIPARSNLVICMRLLKKAMRIGNNRLGARHGGQLRWNGISCSMRLLFASERSGMKCCG
jgi:hypothetical protein